MLIAFGSGTTTSSRWIVTWELMDSARTDETRLELQINGRTVGLIDSHQNFSTS